MTKRILKNYGILAAMLLVFAAIATSCNDDDDDSGINLGDTYLDLVTMQSTSSEGTVFVFRKDNDSPEITLTTKQTFSSGAPSPGERMAISYIPESGKRYESGPVRVVSIAKAYGPGYQTAIEPSDEKSDPLSVLAVWRTEQFLNIQASAQFVSSPSQFRLVLDSETADSEYPEFYLVFRKDFSEATVRYTVFGSYDISGIWNRPGCRGITVHYTDVTGNIETTIRKDAAIGPVPSE